ncbi:hypothetical protein RB653_000700 [Dictyostelium firmibasis]|uniref:Uncharacterized protein n=1 Tax=Dictyostelium firmibasis TaxID=79012 RepID=A0AAN7U2Q7_9MYCE
MNNLLKSLTRLSINAPTTQNSMIMPKRYYSLILDSVEIPKEIEIKHHRPHRKQPTNAHKLLVKRQHQAKINLKIKKLQRSITDWRLAPPHHLPKFDADKVKPAKEYTGNKADQFEEVPFGYKQRKHHKFLENQQEEKRILDEIKQKRLKRHVEAINKEKERKEIFNAKMQARKQEQQE